jgi:hypothetical protein
MEILIKMEKGLALVKFKSLLRDELDEIKATKIFKGVSVVVDVDPN